MPKFRKKPVVIEAVQWTGNNVVEIGDFVDEDVLMWEMLSGDLIIKTLEGNNYANVGDWIIRGVNGEFYPCKLDIFEKTYEAVKGEKEGA
jgi:hypothetical protein